MRIEWHPVLGPAPARPVVTLFWSGRPLPARAGESLAAALAANGVWVLRHSQRGQPRGLYCGIGHCQECRVQVDGVEGVRACLTPVRDGMQAHPGGDGEVSGHGS